MTKWIDPRIPVEVVRHGKFTVTIFDMEGYNESLRQYPDDNVSNEKSTRSNASHQFTKQKPTARYN